MANSDNQPDRQENDFPWDELTAPWLQFWTSFLQHSQETPQQLFKSPGDAAAAMKWRAEWLQAATDSADAYLRSPLFLHMLKHQLDALIAARRRANRRAGDVDENHAEANDVSTEHQQIVQQLDRLERNLLYRIGELERRLVALETQLADDGPPDAKP